MTIKILPARLANQIAAGEVVERPASVVKELVENSLDAGATRIDVDIEKGGAKLIRVRDNGQGIAKEQLTLALSRHATSKIHTLDDLEAIVSLGFRGEALASISSVSRLTLTSRPATQEQACEAYSEGRDMTVKLQPAAHPVGTTVEVLDLFFNTPARRKFLRTEKTEFTHIDELLKRIALSRFDTTINLRHNGKIVRQYRAAKTSLQEEKRIIAVCGSVFAQHMLRIELNHRELKLSGWITTPNGARTQNDVQYCYVNGRMMKDKLINHAIRQSYENSLRSDQFAAYVLFIELDPHQVDVNVHPAKHEVRFHQARLIHDFIYQALSGALAEGHHISVPEIKQSAFHSSPSSTDESLTSTTSTLSEQALFAADSEPSYPNKKISQIFDKYEQDKQEIKESRQPQRSEPKSMKWNPSCKIERHHSPSSMEVSAYKELMRTPSSSLFSASSNTLKPLIEQKPSELEKLGKAVHVIQDHYLLMSSNIGMVLVSLTMCSWLKTRGQLNTKDYPLKSQPLLVPLSLKLSEKELGALVQYEASLNQLGITTKKRDAQHVLIMSVPQPLRQQSLQNLFPSLLTFLSEKIDNNESIDVDLIANWLADHISEVKDTYTLSEAIKMISELEQLWQGSLPLKASNFVQRVDFDSTIAAFNTP